MAYRESGEPKDISLDPEEILRAQKRSTRTKLIVVVVLLLVVGVGGAVTVLVLQARSKKAVKTAYGRFAQCLVGPPLAGTESVALRLRSAQLVAIGMPKDKRMSDEGKDAWPTRCAPITAAFATSLRENGGSADLVAAAEKLGKTLPTEAAVDSDISALVGEVFAKAKTAGLDAERATDVKPPPTAPTVMNRQTLPKEARLVSQLTTLSGVHPSPFTDTTLRFIVDEKDSPAGPVTCTLAAGETTIRCKKIPPPAAQASPALRMWGTTEEKAHVLAFAGDRGKSGIYDAQTGARIVDRLENGAYGATSFADGTVAYLFWNEKPTPATHLAIVKDGKTRDVKVVDRKDSGNPYYSSALFWKWIAYKQTRKGADGIRLVLRAIDPAAKTPLGPPIDIGRLAEIGQIESGEEASHLVVCRNGATSVLSAKGWNNTFLFFERETWSQAVEVRGHSGTLTCDENTAAIVRVPNAFGRYHGYAEVIDCTVSGCTTHGVDLMKMLNGNEDLTAREPKALAAIEVGAKVVLVWSAGDRGGLRMRVGPVEQLANAPETVLYDDHVDGDALKVESTLVGFRLMPFGKSAVLLVATVDGVYAFLVGADGKPTPLPTALD